VPLVTQHLDAAEGLLDSGWRKIIKASAGSPFKKNLPGVPVLNEKIPWMEFKEDAIIKCKTFDRE
jgi:hypothetical protein